MIWLRCPINMRPLVVLTSRCIRLIRMVMRRKFGCMSALSWWQLTCNRPVVSVVTRRRNLVIRILVNLAWLVMARAIRVPVSLIGMVKLLGSGVIRCWVVSCNSITINGARLMVILRRRLTKRIKLLGLKRWKLLMTLLMKLCLKARRNGSGRFWNTRTNLVPCLSSRNRRMLVIIWTIRILIILVPLV